MEYSEYVHKSALRSWRRNNFQCRCICLCCVRSLRRALKLVNVLALRTMYSGAAVKATRHLLNTDMELELDNLARLFHMAIDYSKEIGFGAQFLIEPKPKEPSKHQYDFDAATTIAFLQKYDLKDYFKLNLEANHATLAGHTFEHEIRVAAINGMLGSLDANQGDLLLGWDTDEFPTDLYSTTLTMYEVLKLAVLAKAA